jgi:hypothetical protein
MSTNTLPSRSATGLPGINYQIAPVEGFGIERFVAEAKNGQSSWALV